MSWPSYGAVSADIQESVYLRQDVFNARMNAFTAEIRLMIEQLRTELKQEIQNVRNDSQNIRAELKQEIQTVRTDLEKQIQDLRTELKQEIQTVRNDVQNIRAELKQEIQTVRTDLEKQIQDLRTELKQEIQTVRNDVQDLRGEIRNTNARLDMLCNIVYWGFALLAILIGFPTFSQYFARREKNKPEQQLTADDVKRIVMEILSQQNNIQRT